MMAHKMHVRNFKMKTVEFAVEAMLIDEIAIMDTPFKLHQIEEVAEFSEALLPSCLQVIVSLMCQIWQSGSW